jgi:hypothetical protein
MRAKHILIAVCLLAVVGLSSGQNKSKPAQSDPPNLSGEWILDPSRSNMGNEIHDYTLTVVHEGPEIRFAKRYWRGKREIKEESIYHTDGRADIDPKMGTNSRLETRWRGRKLVHKITSGLNGSQSFNLQVVTYEEWVISNDSQMLTRTITTEAGNLLSRAVFNRVH